MSRVARQNDWFLGSAYLVPGIQRLVGIPSVNPGGNERAVIAAIRQLMDGTGAQLTVVEHEPGRPSLAAVINGVRGGPVLVLNGHTDTVPVDDVSLWNTDPFECHIRDGDIYGRGACDMKASLVIAIAIAHHLVSSVPAEDRGTLILHFAAGEERGEPGTLALIQAGFTGDFGVVMEPTKLQVATATRGVGRYVIRIRGKAGHASDPEHGQNPIWAVGRVLRALERYRDSIGSVTHPMLPLGTCTPTVLRAGVSDNAIPEWCDIAVDRRLLPGETAEAEFLRIADFLNDAQLEGLPEGVTVELSRTLAADPAEIESHSVFGELVLRSVEGVLGGTPVAVGMPYGSDTRNLVNDAGMQALTFGPGDIADCHSANERVSVREVEAAARILADVVTSVLVDGTLDKHRSPAKRAD